MPRRAELPNINPARLDIPHYRGDSLSARLHLQSQGVAVDVSHWGFEAYIRENIDGPKITEFTVFRDELNGADPINGIIRMVLPFPSARLLPATCIWDLEATEYDPISNAPIRVRTLLRGFIYTPGDVTYPSLDADSLSAQSAGRR